MVIWIDMGKYNLDTYITGRNSRVLQITGELSADVTDIQVLRSFSPINSQSLDDGKLYGENPYPVFRVYIDDPYDQDNRLGEDKDDWEILGYMDNGSCIYVDDERLPWNKSRDVYYKMRVYTGDNYTDTPIVSAGRGSSYASNSVVKGLINAINFEINENGRNGYLLKARHWGKKCSKCLDFGTNRVINGNCPVCYGIGYEGGYYEAMSMPIIDEAPHRQQGRSKEDYVESEVIQARCVANPIVLRGDIWVSCNTNDRYLIDQCTPTSLYKGIPIVYTLVMKKLPQSDVIFEKNVENIIEDSYINWELVGK